MHCQVLYGLEYSHAISDIEKALVSNASRLSGSRSTLECIYADVSSSAMSPSKTCEPANQSASIDSSAVNECLDEQTSQNYNLGGLSWRLPQGWRMEDYLVFWIGLDNPAFANVVLTFNTCEIGEYSRYLGAPVITISFCIISIYCIFLDLGMTQISTIV